MYVGNYYVLAIVTARSSSQFVAFISPLASFISALLVAYIWTQPNLGFVPLPEHLSQSSSRDHRFSGGVILAVICFILGTVLYELLLQRYITYEFVRIKFVNFYFIFHYILYIEATRMLSRSDVLQQRNNKGQLVGFSEGGLPLYNAGMANNPSKRSFTSILKSSIHQILGQSHTRRIFFYLCLNLVR